MDNQERNIRLAKVAKEIGITINTIVNVLNKKGIYVESNPNAKISEKEYKQLLEFFKIKNIGSSRVETLDELIKANETLIADKITNTLSPKTKKNPSSISFENFRRFISFNKVEYGPITFLVGRNNSGKSTMVKAMLLVLNYLKSNQVNAFNLSTANIGDVNIVTFGRAKNVYSSGDFISFEWIYDQLVFEIKITGNTETTSPRVTYFSIEDLEDGFSFIFEPQEAQLTIEKHTVKNIEDSNDDNLLLKQLISKESQLKAKIEGIKQKSSEEYISSNDELRKIRERIKILKNKAKNQSVDSENFTLSSFYTSNNVESIIEECVKVFSNEYTRQYSEIQAGKRKRADFEHYQAFKENMIKLEKKVKDILNHIERSKMIHLGASINKQAALFSIRDNNNALAQAVHEYKQLGIDKDHGSDAHKFVKYWMNEERFEIGDSFDIVMHAGEAYEVIVQSHGLQIPLADKGMGSIQAMLLILRLAVIIYKKQLHGHNYTVIIEEPELNLHPALQSKLADIFHEVYDKYKIKLIVETHSEYLIRKTQLIVKENDYEVYPNENPFSVVYFDKEMRQWPMNYRTDGVFIDDFGPGFFDVASQQAISLFKRK